MRLMGDGDDRVDGMAGMRWGVGAFAIEITGITGITGMAGRIGMTRAMGRRMMDDRDDGAHGRDGMREMCGVTPGRDDVHDGPDGNHGMTAMRSSRRWRRSLG